MSNDLSAAEPAGAGRVAHEGHPAPARGRIPLKALWFGLFGGPVAWSIQTLVNLPLAAHACFPRLEPLATPDIGGLQGLVLAVSVAAVVVCAAASVVAWTCWRRTRDEEQQSSGRGREHAYQAALLETGEGRTRFMALAGVLTSLTFLVVSALHGMAIFLVPPCGG